MTELYTIVTGARELGHLSRIRPVPRYARAFQLRHGDLAPVCANIRGKPVWISARWGIPHKGKTIYNITMERIMARKPFGLWLRRFRCSIPVNCFYVFRDEHTFLVRILKQRTFMLGGVCIPPENNSGEYRFATLETESADIVLKICQTTPVNFDCHKTEQWIIESSMLKVMYIADVSTDRWYDFYKVSPEIRGAVNEKSLLAPAAISYREWIEREEKLKSLDLREDRFDRNNSKGRR